MADIRKSLTEYLRELHLSTMRRQFEEEARRAERETLSYEQYLLELARAECEERHTSRVERLLRQSRLPLDKNLETFDLKRLPAKVARQYQTLLDGTFLQRRENVLLFGATGSGKTHGLCALGQELIRRFCRKVLLCKCNLLVQELLVAKRDLKLTKVLKKFNAVEALIIDDIGYVQQSREEMEVLFTLLAERYERGSVLLTSNLPFSKWEQIFKDPMTTAAAIDRLVHHSVILELNIPSYRLEQAKKARQESEAKETEAKETEAKETEAKETEAKETEAKETEAPKKAEAKPRTKKADAKKTEAKKEAG
jgi:DNA replication protein DnaC